MDPILWIALGTIIGAPFGYAVCWLRHRDEIVGLQDEIMALDRESDRPSHLRRFGRKR